MALLKRISRGGWRPTLELKFINGKLAQKWEGDILQHILPWPSPAPQVINVEEQEWREIPGQE